MEFENSLITKIMRLREEMKVDGKLVRKFVGSVTVESLRKELMKAGFNVSNRDVFVKGVLYELDLLISKKGELPEENLLYRPEQVVAVFEVKFNGAYPGDLEKIKMFFNSVKKVNKKIKCFYLTIGENTNHEYYRKETELGDGSFFLFSYKSSDLADAIEKGRTQITGDWDRLMKRLNELNN